MIEARPRLLDLCSGIGGFSLAASWLGIETIGFCEIDPWCQRVLAKNFPGVPIHDDLKTLTGTFVRGWLGGTMEADDVRNAATPRPASGPAEPRPQIRHEARRTESERRNGSGHLTLITAGYPCQPFSHAGKRLGTEDDRHLWPYIARLVDDLRPRYCLFENVAGHISLGLDDVLSDLEALGYACRSVVVPACAVNAPHRRDRVWIVAHAGGERRQQIAGSAHGNEAANEGRTAEHDYLAQCDGEGDGARTLGNADAERCDGWPYNEGQRPAERNGTPLAGWWATEPDVGRVAHGIPKRVDRLRGLGNAIVPQVAYVILSSMLASA